MVRAHLWTTCDVKSIGRRLVESDLPGRSGLGLLSELRRRGATLPTILLVAKSTSQVRSQGQESGVLNTIENPLLNNFLVRRLAVLLPSLVILNTPKVMH